MDFWSTLWDTFTNPSNNIYPDEPANARGASSLLCIDVFFHIVRNTNGTDAFLPPNLDDVVSNLNEFYSPHNIVINNLGSDFIDDTNFLTLFNGEQDALFDRNQRTDAINFYITNSLWGTVVGVADDIPSTSLVIREDWVLTSISAHEFGHCLNLYHTFQGSSFAPNTTCAEAIMDLIAILVEI